MKGNDMARVSACPRCGRAYSGRPALSRADNETPICPDCSIREALESIGVGAEEQEEILGTIHRYARGRGGGERGGAR